VAPRATRTKETRRGRGAGGLPDLHAWASTDDMQPVEDAEAECRLALGRLVRLLLLVRLPILVGT
jgi:hypothetical protein